MGERKKERGRDSWQSQRNVRRKSEREIVIYFTAVGRPRYTSFKHWRTNNRVNKSRHSNVAFLNRRQEFFSRSYCFKIFQIVFPIQTSWA